MSCQMTSRMLYLHATVRPDASVASWAMHYASESNVASGMRISILPGVTIAIKKWPSCGSDVDGAAGICGVVSAQCHRLHPAYPKKTMGQPQTSPRSPRCTRWRLSLRPLWMTVHKKTRTQRVHSHTYSCLSLPIRLETTV